MNYTYDIFGRYTGTTNGNPPRSTPTAPVLVPGLTPYWSGTGWVNSPAAIPKPVDVPPPTPPPPLPPIVISRRQLRLALLDIGKLNAVTAAINGLGPAAKARAQIEWDCLDGIKRDNPFLATLVAGLGLTTPQADALFTAATLL